MIIPSVHVHPRTTGPRIDDHGVWCACVWFVSALVWLAIALFTFLTAYGGVLTPGVLITACRWGTVGIGP